MAVTHLKFKIDPEQIPVGIRGKFLELYDPKAEHAVFLEDAYVGWVQFHEDGTIEFGEPGE